MNLSKLKGKKLEEEISRLSQKITVFNEIRDLSKLNGEEHVKRIELAINFFRKITKNNHKKNPRDLSTLYDLGVIDEYQLMSPGYFWDSASIKKSLSLDVSFMLFNSLNVDGKEWFDFWCDDEKERDIVLGLFVADLYNQKEAHTRTTYFDQYFKIIGEETLLKEYTPVYTNSDKQNKIKKIRKKVTGDRVSGLIDKIIFKAEDYVHSHYYSKTKKYYGLALKLLNKNKDLIEDSFKSYLIKKINKSKHDSLFSHKKWIKDYSTIKKPLNENLRITSELTDDEIVTINGNFEKFKNNYTKLDYFAEKAYYQAIKDYCLESIKILKQKDSPTIKQIVSKLYTLYSWVDKDEHSFGQFKQNEIEFLKEAIKFDPNNLYPYYYLARYYENKNEKDKALIYWDDLIKSYFKVKDRVYENIKSTKCSKNLVGGIRGGEIFKKLIFKISKDDLSDEYNTTKLIYESIHHKRFVSEPVALIKKEDTLSYLILRKAEDEGTLEDILENFSKLKGNSNLFTKIHWASEKEIIKKLKLKYLEKVLDFLVGFQDSGKKLESSFKNYNYSNKLEIKLEELFGHKKEEAYKACSFLIDYLNNLPSQLGHGDFNPRNILAVKGGFCIIDYEKVGIVNRYFDLTYLLEQLDLTWENKTELIKYFKKKIKDNSSVNEVIKTYDHNALFVNLTLAGTCSQWEDRALEYQSLKQKYLNRTKELLKKMENLYGLKLSTLKSLCGYY